MERHMYISYNLFTISYEAMMNYVKNSFSFAICAAKQTEQTPLLYCFLARRLNTLYCPSASTYLVKEYENLMAICLRTREKKLEMGGGYSLDVFTQELPLHETGK